LVSDIGGNQRLFTEWLSVDLTNSGIKTASRPLACRFLSGDGPGLAQVACFHRHPAAAAANEFHRGQLVLADVLAVGVRGSAKTAILRVSAGIAQMAGRVGRGPAIFTCVCHGRPPCVLVKPQPGRAGTKVSYSGSVSVSTKKPNQKIDPDTDPDELRKKLMTFCIELRR